MNKFIEYTGERSEYVEPERKYANELIEIRLYCGHKDCNQYIKGIEGYNGLFSAETGQQADLRNQEWRCEIHS